MEEKEILQFFKEKLSENNIEVSNEKLEKFILYMKNLQEWNTKINLTAIKDEKDIIIKHFIDSIFISKYLDGKRVVDIGAGAGFPGIPLKIFDDDLNITLLDAVNKKVLFMNDSITKLDLKNIIALHGRAEDYAHNKEYRECFDVATSRAVANMSTLVEYMLPFVKVGGSCLCMKGPNSEEEINEAKVAISRLGGHIEEVINYSLEDNERCLIVIKKIKKTEQIYPRNQGKPLKNPIR